jgi:hypothetical protein
MKYSALSLSIAASLLLSCNKPELSVPGSGSNINGNSGSVYTPSAGTPTGVSGQYGLPANPPSNSILIDASKDGGVWWYPQSAATGLSAANNHQGKALADYLRSLEYQVYELPQGAVITEELLSKYSRVIRAVAFYNYTPEEVAAYESFLSRHSSLFLISEHMTHTVNDRLSERLGLKFEGSYWGPVKSFQSHPLTNGVSSVSYVAGSVIKNWDISKITVLGSIGLLSGEEGTGIGTMGIVNHPSSKIFFTGDIGAIENLEQPFTSNVIKWLFQ